MVFASKRTLIVHQQHHSQTPAQQQQQQAQHSGAYSYPQQSQASNSQDHTLPYYAHPSPYSTPGATSGYTTADTGDMMAATMPRPYPPISYHTPQSNSPASVASPSGHDQQRSMYAQPPSQLHQQQMYYGAPQQQYSSMPAQAAQSPYAQHAQQPHQPMASQPSMMMSHTPPQHPISQHPSQHSQAGMTVSPRPDKIETHSLGHRISGPSAPVAMGGASSASPQNGAPLSTPTTTGSGVNANAAPGPIPATTPLVVRQDTNGVQWIAFEYSRDRVKMEYTIRCDVESVNQDELTPEFKSENCVYPRACCPKEQYRGNRLQYETECNTVGWALAQLNPPLRGKRGLIQRAVDSWRNSNQDPRLRSRRVRRMAKMNYRNGKAGSTTPHATHIPAPGAPGSTGMTTPTPMGPGSTPAMGKPGLPMAQQMHHHHGGQQDGSAQGGDEVGEGNYGDNQSHHHHHHQPPVQPGSDERPAHVFTGYDAYHGAPHASSSMSMHDSLGDASHGAAGPLAAHRSTSSRGAHDGPDDLFPDIPEAKKRKFILVEDSDRNSRLRVRVTLDGVDTHEIPDSFRKSSSVYPRSYFPREMQSPPPSATGSSFFTDDLTDTEDDGTTDTEGRRPGRAGRSARARTMVKVPLAEGREGEVAIPRMRKMFRGKEVRLNDLGYRMAWLQSRVFAGRTVFLQRALDCYRNKTRNAMESMMQDVKTAAPHYETRVGKRKWNERMRAGEKEDES
ncbi:b18afef6-09e2-42ef-a296-b9d99416fb9a [Thermothielavioides terrestris]|uniref:B18afef6-09e2-42ef-a296-b9d99416fb9a n=1 Tax=Thermothielavioides terrestris TaxID=2587410 RepID=A0A3S4AP72_9PEZI|nr:b18afef6-09e2-42ef-a296-b9d99416fb9a [Thermothielavioides terrestris]